MRHCHCPVPSSGSCSRPFASPIGIEETLAAGSAGCALLGSTLLVDLNPERRDCFGADAVSPRRFNLYGRDDGVTTVEGSHLEDREAEALRLGHYRRVDVVLGAV